VVSRTDLLPLNSRLCSIGGMHAVAQQLENLGQQSANGLDVNVAYVTLNCFPRQILAAAGTHVLGAAVQRASIKLAYLLG
jgi:hypothetical protein